MASLNLDYINWLDSPVHGNTNYCLLMNTFVSTLTIKGEKKKKNQP